MLVNPLKMIQMAQQRKVAIAAFNIHNLETIQAVIEGAVEENAPVIIQTTPGTLKHAGIPYIGAIVKEAAELYNIPIALHVDHCTSYETIVQCIQNGYTSVMIDGSKLPYEENVQLVRKVVELGRCAGVAVEAEIGRIGGTEDDLTVSEKEALLTDPSEALAFVKHTNVDTLAVAIGTAHGMYIGEPKLDFERISEIKKLVDIPLVLHGASGVPNQSVNESIDRGMCKVNIATELKNPMAEAIRRVLSNENENDPRNYMGEAKISIKEVVKQKIKLCGSSGLASELMNL